MKMFSMVCSLAALAGISMAMRPLALWQQNNAAHPPMRHNPAFADFKAPQVLSDFKNANALGEEAISDEVEEEQENKGKIGNILKKIVIYSLLLPVKPIFLALSPIQGINYGNFAGGHYNNNDGLPLVEYNQQQGKAPPKIMIPLAHSGMDCQNVVYGGGKESGFNCTLKMELDWPNKYNLLMNTGKGSSEFVKIAEVDPTICEIDRNQHEKGDEGGANWTPVVGKKAKKMAKKVCRSQITISAEEMEKLPKFDEKEAEEWREREIAQRYGQIAAKSGKTATARKLLQAQLDRNFIAPGSVQDHILWNDENGSNSVLVRVRHFLVQKPSVPSVTVAPPNYTFCASYSPFYAPGSITDMGCIDATAPTSPSTAQAPAPAAHKKEAVAPAAAGNQSGSMALEAPAPAAVSNATKLPLTYMAVCSETPDKVWTLCTWTVLYNDGNGQICTKAYYHDGMVQKPDTLIGCNKVKGCALSGKGC